MPRNAVTPGKGGHFWMCLVSPVLWMEKKRLFKEEEIRIQAPSLLPKTISGTFCTTLEWWLQKQMLHQRSCTSQTFSDLTPTWLDLSPTAVSQTKEQAKEHHYDITSVRTCLNTSVCYIPITSKFVFLSWQSGHKPNTISSHNFLNQQRINTIPHVRSEFQYFSKCFHNKDTSESQHSLFQALPNSQLRVAAGHHPGSKGKLQ